MSDTKLIGSEIRTVVGNALKSEFIQNIVTLFTGTALAQLIPLLIAPVLTRIYSPLDYGVLALFTAFTTFGALFSTLRYDVAILLPADDTNAIKLVFLSGFCAFSVAVFCELLIFMLHGSLVQLMKNPAIGPWLYFVPPCFTLAAWNISLNYWLNRHKQFRRIGINRIIVAILVACANLAAGFAGLGYTGLILAVFVEQAATFTILLAWTWRDVIKGLWSLRLIALVQIARKYRQFPFFSLPADAVNSLAQQVPVFMLSHFFGGTVVGHYSFAQRILGLPVSLLSKTVSDVFKQRVSADYSRVGHCKDVFDKTFKMLSLFSVFPFIVLFFLAPFLFEFIFGAEWVQAGQYARYLAAFYFVKFVVSPLSYVFYVANRQDADLFGQVALLVISVGSMLLGAFSQSPDLAIIYFSFGYILVYGFYLWGAFRLSVGKRSLFNFHT